MPAVTVVITAYNLEKYLARCLDELLAQSMQDFSVLLIDDASTDGTRDVADAYIARCPDRILAVYLDQNLGSPAKTRNAALDSGLIDGAYTLFLDGDDRIEPDCLAALYAAATAQGADIALCAYDRVEAGSEHVLCRELGWLPEAGIELPPESDAPAFVNSALWNKLIKTELCLSCRLPDFRIGEDLCYALALMQRANRIACVPRALVHYYVRAGSVMSTAQRADATRFADELHRMYLQATPAWREVLALVSFLHIGLSMPLGVSRQKNVPLAAYCRETRAHLLSAYGLYRGRKYLRLCSLIRRGMKGLCLFGALTAYRLRLFMPVLSCYRLLCRVLHIEIKF